MTTLSVVIAAFNAEATLARAIDSALNQTRLPDEIVVCDDGSTDGTSDVIASYGDRIIAITKPNGGLSTARNTAIAEASGEFVALLDADDEWLPDRVRATCELIGRRPEVDVVSCQAVWIRLDGSRPIIFAEDVPSPDRQRAEILRNNFLFAGSAIRRSAIVGIGGFAEDVSHQSEYEGWVRLILSGCQSASVTQPLARYYQTPGSLSSSPAPTWRVIIETHERVMERFDLNDEERSAAREHVERAERALRLIAAWEALISGIDVRARAFAIAKDSSQGRRSRLKWFAVLLSPKLAQRATRATEKSRT